MGNERLNRGRGRPSVLRPDKMNWEWVERVERVERVE